MNRCPWAKSDLYIEYHDNEWGTPVHDDRLLFEFRFGGLGRLLLVVLFGEGGGLGALFGGHLRDHLAVINLQVEGGEEAGGGAGGCLVARREGAGGERGGLHRPPGKRRPDQRDQEGSPADPDGQREHREEDQVLVVLHDGFENRPGGPGEGEREKQNGRRSWERSAPRTDGRLESAAVAEPIPEEVLQIGNGGDLFSAHQVDPGVVWHRGRQRDASVEAAGCVDAAIPAAQTVRTVGRRREA